MLTDPVKIDVVNRQAALILIDQGKRGAAHPSFFADPNPAAETADKASFARAQFADQDR